MIVRTLRLLAVALAAGALALIAAACGGNSAAGAKSAFAWLSARPAPAAWPTARIPAGARIAYPQGWKRIAGDPGTATVALLSARGRYLGYLNLTPRQGDERLNNWSRFRAEHNRDEGNRHVTTLATAPARPFAQGRISCVEDSYATATGADYIEIACLALGSRGGVVVVGASPPETWKRVSSQLERAISSLSV